VQFTDANLMDSTRRRRHEQLSRDKLESRRRTRFFLQFSHLVHDPALCVGGHTRSLLGSAIVMQVGTSHDVDSRAAERHQNRRTSRESARGPAPGNLAG
jgi:hypothetical protein